MWKTKCLGDFKLNTRQTGLRISKIADILTGFYIEPSLGFTKNDPKSLKKNCLNKNTLLMSKVRRKKKADWVKMTEKQQ